MEFWKPLHDLLVNKHVEAAHSLPILPVNQLVLVV
jgi:hypothetical protein